MLINCIIPIQIAFENLPRETVHALKKLASNKRIFSCLEAKVLETKKQMETLKQFMIDVQKVKNEDLNNKGHSPQNLTCHYCCMKGHTIEKCKFKRFLVPKGVFQWFPWCNQGFTSPQGPREVWVYSISCWSCKKNVLALRREYGFLVSRRSRYMTSDISLSHCLCENEEGLGDLERQ